MPRLGSRRLPQRLDYTLVPAPLDLSLPLVAANLPLPAIIVTPSSPTSKQDFSIAFLAPPPKPTLRERLSSLAPSKLPTLPSKTRTFIVIIIMVFVMICHVVTHRLATRRPHLEFSAQTGEAHLVDASINWFDFRSVMGMSHDTGALSSAPPKL